MSYTPIEKVSVTPEERETGINITPYTKRARIYSSDPVMIRKIRTLLTENESVLHLVHEDRYGMEVEVPASWIKIAKPRNVNMSDEQRAACAERMKAWRNSQKEPAAM